MAAWLLRKRGGVREREMQGTSIKMFQDLEGEASVVRCGLRELVYTIQVDELIGRIESRARR